VTKVGDSADSDFFVGDYPRVRGILGESWVHRSVKDGRWETVRRWIRRSRESAISSPRLSEPELSPEFEELESHTEGGEEFVGLGIGTATSDTEASDSKGNLSRKTSIGSRVVGGGIGTPKPASSKVNEWLEKSGGINARWVCSRRIEESLSCSLFSSRIFGYRFIVRSRFRTIVGTTPLHEACSMIPYFSNDSDKPSPTTANAAHTVSDLLAQGADPLLRDLFGLTPLHRACIAGNMEVIKALLECTSPVVAQQQLAVTDNHGAFHIVNRSCKLTCLCLQATHRFMLQHTTITPTPSWFSSLPAQTWTPAMKTVEPLFTTPQKVARKIPSVCLLNPGNRRWSWDPTASTATTWTQTRETLQTGLRYTKQRHRKSPRFFWTMAAQN
jgi:hypothetical protein